jgi:AcrR family transcriptional regulator
MAATRSAIIDASIHAFRVNGYSATKIESVAALAGISPRTLYRYFGSKSELFAATIAEAAIKFVEQLSETVYHSSLNGAILEAVERTTGGLNKETLEMMRLTSIDEEVWRYFLAATSRVQPALATTLRHAAGKASPGSAPPVDELVWDVRAGVVLAAIGTAYRRWAMTPDSRLSKFVTIAVDTVLPSLRA